MFVFIEFEVLVETQLIMLICLTGSINLNLIRQVSARYLEAICIVDVKFWGQRNLSKEKYVEESKDSGILNGNVQCEKKKGTKSNKPLWLTIQEGSFLTQ